MPTERQPNQPQSIPNRVLQGFAGRASDYIRRSKAASTLLIYRSDWNDFENWCQSYGKTPLPASPETVGLYLSDLSTRLKPSTLARHSAAICYTHRSAGMEPPTRDVTVRMLMSGIRRQHGTAPVSKKALLVPDLKRVVSGLPDKLIGTRDRALILVGFCGGFRRSEIVALDFSDFEFSPQGVAITVRRSKTDQFGRGRRIGIPYTSAPETCPVKALERWLETSGIKEGPAFRPVTRHGKVRPTRLSAHAVARIVKRRAKDAGLDPRQISGHSLRSGLATSAAMNGAAERKIMDQTGHRSLLQVRKYIQRGSVFQDNVVGMLGL